MSDYQTEQATKVTELQTLAAAVASHLAPGWSLMPVNQNDSTWNNGVLVNGPLQIRISIDGWNQVGRIAIADRAWPSYTETDTNNYSSGSSLVKTTHVYPRDLPAGERPADTNMASMSITVSKTKSPAQVAADITRRFLPTYTRLYYLCAQQALQLQATRDNSQANWSAICATVGPSAVNQWKYQSIETKGGRLSLTREHAGQAKLEMTVSPAQLALIIAALGGRK
jgi:hypothetical protein